MVTQIAFTVIVLLVILERILELRISTKHAAISFAKGGMEFGKDHYFLMVAAHGTFLVGMVLEVWLLDRPFIWPLAFTMLLFAIAAQVIRWWVIFTLGEKWNTRVIVVPRTPLIKSGPFLWMSHPNYAAVMVEAAALPLIHTAWLSAIFFSVINILILYLRIPCENKALELLEEA